MIRPAWDFDYRPTAVPQASVADRLDDFILATTCGVDPAYLVQVLGRLAPGLRVEPLLDWHPLYWTRVRSDAGIERAACEACLAASGVPARYLATARCGSQDLPPPLDLQGLPPARATHWRARPPSTPAETNSAGRWFVEACGVDVDRRVCGTGAGTRLAVIDNDGGETEHLDLDAHVLVGTDYVPGVSSHAALMVAWAVRAVRMPVDPDGGLIGIAPDASPRLYSIPKPGTDVIHLPLAIVHAVIDGADVVMCATNVDGQWSPMLDDALAIASQLGRHGRGTAVVLPCSRETSSPEGSTHSSLSLGAGEPAADPRVFCVAPSSRAGDWFLWRDRRGRLHPFANRGPALRWLAPGDDVALPFSSPEVLGHAESSGASAIAAGVLLLVLGRNPALTLSELEQVLTSTVATVDPQVPVDRRSLTDPYDILPTGRDRDGHNAKHGYGRLDATRACLLVSDPLAFALVSLGEDEAARRWVELQADVPDVGGLLPAGLAAWAVRALLADASQRHAICALARSLRLFAARPERLRSQAPGATWRQVLMLLRDLPRSRHAAQLEPAQRQELGALEARARDLATRPEQTAAMENHLCRLATMLWPVLDSGQVGPRRASAPPLLELLGA
jgi:hypothetical protein